MLSRFTVSTVVLVLSATQAGAQADSGKVTVVAREGDRPLADAVVRSGHVRSRTDGLGAAILWLPVGLRRVIVASIGFRPETVSRWWSGRSSTRR